MFESAKNQRSEAALTCSSIILKIINQQNKEIKKLLLTSPSPRCIKTEFKLLKKWADYIREKREVKDKRLSTDL